MDGGQIHHIQGIEGIAVQAVLQQHEVRQVLDIHVGGGVGEDLGGLLVQRGLLVLVGAGVGLAMTSSYSGLL